MLECGSCGAGAPVDEHFCPQCSRILALNRHGDYFAFLGLPRKLVVDAQDLERRFRQLSRQFHPDFFHNAPPAERLASLERSSYLNDAYRVMRSAPARIEYLLSLEGFPPIRIDQANRTQVPAELLEEVFTLNEALDDIRSAREEGADAASLRTRLAEAEAPVERKRQRHEHELDTLSAKWDALPADAPAEERRQTLDALRARMLERHYITNLLAAIDEERQRIGG
jgi:molecular chaperone HscB